MQNFTIAVHGGAGTIHPSMLTPQLEQDYKTGLQAALQAALNVLEGNGSALHAVEQAVIALENNELFNAGKGAVFTNTGTHELDACIMNGSNLLAGSIAGVVGIKNPVSLSRQVMEQTEHVLLCGEGALQFAKAINMEIADDSYFYNKFRFEQWQSIKDSVATQLDHSSNSEKKFGTVGAVAKDKFGNIAAATSTGGMTNKRYGRLGDSCIVGSGTYANNETCAISCTGHGEFFIRSVVAYDVSCLMEYKNLSLEEACHKVVLDKLVKIGGEGGLIAVDALGNHQLVFNSEGMYRGVANSSGLNEVAIYK
jgi:L-asparaginase / beta-aspartyl-peptidase